MNSAEYVEACKKRLNCESYYQLAKELNISNRELDFYRHGQRTANAYACFKFGECLGIEPSLIIADIASECEKNPLKRDYFKGFIGRCLKAVAALILTTALMHTVSEESSFAV